MARTKAEVRAFLDSQVGRIVPHPGNPGLNGQCVTLTKALMEFLGVSKPYAARGNAKDAGTTYITQDIGEPGKGWLTVCVNKNMGGGYGHIWIDLAGEANYESNGARALYTTKNTRPFSQSQQFINFDKWIKDGGDIVQGEDGKEIYRTVYHREPENDQVWRQWDGRKVGDVLRQNRTTGEWLSQNHAIKFFADRENQLNAATAALANANKKLQDALANDASDRAAITAAQKQAQDALNNLNKVSNDFNDVKKQLDDAKAEKEAAEKTGNVFLRWLGDQLNRLIGKG